METAMLPLMMGRAVLGWAAAGVGLGLGLGLV